jgi:hypothetical protein
MFRAEGDFAGDNIPFSLDFVDLFFKLGGFAVGVTADFVEFGLLFFDLLFDFKAGGLIGLNVLHDFENLRFQLGIIGFGRIQLGQDDGVSLLVRARLRALRSFVIWSSRVFNSSSRRSAWSRPILISSCLASSPFWRVRSWFSWKSTLRLHRASLAFDCAKADFPHVED